MLSETQIERYERHILLPEIGGQGQEKLLAAKVLIVGLGGLGAPAALYLAAAGVGTLGLVDHDVVERSNLHRQILYADAECGQPKVELAAARLRALNPEVRLVPYPVRLEADNAAEILRDYDVVLDGSDNFPTRYLVNDTCVRLGRPNAFGSVLGFEGQVAFFPPEGPCYRCAFPSPPPPGTVPTCAEAGVVGPITGIVGSIQAVEILKWLLGLESTLQGRLLLVDALTMRFEDVTLVKDPACPACGSGAALTRF